MRIQSLDAMLTQFTKKELCDIYRNQLLPRLQDIDWPIALHTPKAYWTKSFIIDACRLAIDIIQDNHEPHNIPREYLDNCDQWYPRRYHMYFHQYGYPVIHFHNNDYVNFSTYNEAMSLNNHVELLYGPEVSYLTPTTAAPACSLPLPPHCQLPDPQYTTWLPAYTMDDSVYYFTSYSHVPIESRTAARLSYDLVHCFTRDQALDYRSQGPWTVPANIAYPACLISCHLEQDNSHDFTAH